MADYNTFCLLEEHCKKLINSYIIRHPGKHVLLFALDGDDFIEESFYKGLPKASEKISELKSEEKPITPDNYTFFIKEIPKELPDQEDIRAVD